MTVRVRRLVALLGMVGLAGPAAAAAAGDVFSIGFYGPSGPGKLVAARELTLAARGGLTVTFHGDRAAGCAKLGACGTSGVIVVSTPQALAASVEEFRLRLRHQPYALGLFIGQDGQATTVTRVSRPGGVCIDSAQPFTTLDMFYARGTLRIAPLSSTTSELTTRCAGPLDADLAAAVPSVAVPDLQALRAGRRLDLSGTRRFSGHGYSVLIDSSLVLRVLTSAPQSTSQSGPPPGEKLVAIRQMTLTLKVRDLSGTEVTSFRGDTAGGICRLLDSCHTSGTIRVPLSGHSLNLRLTALGRAHRPLRDFRAALGLGGPGDTRGIRVVGSLELPGRRFLTEQSGACSDTVEAESGIGSLLSGGPRFHVSLFGGIERTRCAGPLASGDTAAPAGSFPRSLLARRAFTVSTSQTTAFQDDGYVGRITARLRMRLVRGRITQRISQQPDFTAPSGG